MIKLSHFLSHLLLSLGLSLVGRAQQPSPLTPVQVDLGVEQAREPATRTTYPSLRILSVQYDVFTPRQVTLTGQDVPRFQARQATQQLRVSGGLPLLISKPLRLITNFAYLRDQSDYQQIVAAGNANQLSPRQLTRQDIALSFMGIHTDSLFHRPVTYVASITGSSRNLQRLEKLSGFASASIRLKNTPVTELAAGLFLQVNLTTNVPVLPLLTYWHRLAKGGWEIDAVLPLRAQLRHPLPLASKGWLSLGTQTVSSHSFGSTSYQPLHPTFELNTLSLQTGALVEYPVQKKLLLGFRTGLRSQINSRVSRKNTADYLFRLSSNKSFYFGACLSFVPR